MARRYVVSVAVGTVLAVAVTGCRVGGDAGPKKAAPAPVRVSAQDVVAQVSQKTNQMRSFRITLASSLDVLPKVGPIKMRAHGVAPSRGQVTGGDNLRNLPGVPA